MTLDLAKFFEYDTKVPGISRKTAKLNSIKIKNFV